MGRYLSSEYLESFAGFSSRPYRAGHMMMGVSSVIQNSRDSSRPGDITLEVQFKDSGTTPTWIRVWAIFPGAREYEHEFFFKQTMTPLEVVKKLGPAIKRDLDYWMANVVGS